MQSPCVTLPKDSANSLMSLDRPCKQSIIEIFNEALRNDYKKKYDGKYPIYGISEFIKYSGMSKNEINLVIDYYTNPVIFKQNPDGTFMRDDDGSLIKNFEIR